jgi:hypothetical protein
MPNAFPGEILEMTDPKVFLTNSGWYPGFGSASTCGHASLHAALLLLGRCRHG